MLQEQLYVVADSTYFQCFVKRQQISTFDIILESFFKTKITSSVVKGHNALLSNIHFIDPPIMKVYFLSVVNYSENMLYLKYIG